MKMMEKEGRTVEEAIEDALLELQIKREDAEIEIIEDPVKGFLGFGSKPAKIRVSEKFSVEKEIKKFLDEICRHMGLDPYVEINQGANNCYNVSMSGSDMGIMIGRRGDTLDAIQFLSNLNINRKTDYKVKVIIDIEGYREKRAGSLDTLARKMANKALKIKRKVVLEPMSPQERRIIHLALQDDNRITTFSEGEEPYRRIVILPKRKN